MTALLATAIWIVALIGVSVWCLTAPSDPPLGRKEP
jgi:type IV secretory pathway TrbD component